MPFCSRFTEFKYTHLPCRLYLPLRRFQNAASDSCLHYLLTISRSVIKGKLVNYYVVSEKEEFLLTHAYLPIHLLP